MTVWLLVFRPCLRKSYRIKNDQTGANTETSPKQLEPHTEEQLREELNLFQVTLPGSGRSCVGGTSLSSGITISLIDDIVKNIFLLTSLEEIEAQLPIYSNCHGYSLEYYPKI